MNGLDAGKKGGTGGHHIVDDKDVTACKAGGFGDIIDIAGVHPTCVGPTSSLGAVAARGDKIVSYGQADDIGNTFCDGLRLVVAAPDEFAPMERHREQKVYTVKKSVRGYLACKHRCDPTRYHRTRGILCLMDYRPIGTVVIIVEIARGTLNGHLARDALVHRVERLAVNHRARQPRETVEAHHLLAVAQRLATDLAHPGKQQPEQVAGQGA